VFGCAGMHQPADGLQVSDDLLVRFLSIDDRQMSKI
jgi:hypothetical protein